MQRNYPAGTNLNQDYFSYLRKKQAEAGAGQDLIDLEGGDMALASGMDAVAADSAGINSLSGATSGLGDQAAKAGMASGNPYAMAAGLGLKAATLGLDLYNASEADERAEKDRMRKENIENEMLGRNRQQASSAITDRNMSRVIDWSNFNEGQGPDAEQLNYYRRQRA